ncbi:MAG: ABC transporter permease [Hyphomonadaceae bacterium]
MMDAHAAKFSLSNEQNGAAVLSVSGDWTIWTIGGIEKAVRAASGAYPAALDVTALDKVDTSGAYLIERMLSPDDAPASGEVRIIGDHGVLGRLLEEVRSIGRAAPPEPVEPPGIVALLERVGHGAVDAWKEFLGNLAFIGEAMATLARLIIRPQKIRWTSVVAVMEEAGLDALPIVAFLSMFIGLVIAFIGANLLAMFNASVFTVELVGIGVLREFGAVITGVLLAGRTDSAFTAQIGAMKMRQEIDAMRVIGLDPMEALVAPRLIALLVMTPILTFAAMIAGIGGGVLAAWAAMDISPTLFMERFKDAIPPQHFWVGIVKAPVFAIVIALVGCRQGMRVGGDVISLGRRTTSSVVQSIFLVITIDAIFAILYYLIDV